MKETEPKIEFKEIFNWNISKQKSILKRFEESMKSIKEKCIYIIIGAIPASSVCHKFSRPLIGQSCSRQLVPDWLGDVYRLGEVYTVQPVYTGPDPGWPLTMRHLYSQSVYMCTNRYPRGAPELWVEKKLCCQSLGQELTLAQNRAQHNHESGNIFGMSIDVEIKC